MNNKVLQGVPIEDPLTEFVEETSANDPYPFKLHDVARICNVHRVTMLRYETRGIIPLAKWRRLPQPHRVYSKADLENIQAILMARAPKGRDYVDEVVEATTNDD